MGVFGIGLDIFHAHFFGRGFWVRDGIFYESVTRYNGALLIPTQHSPASFFVFFKGYTTLHIIFVIYIYTNGLRTIFMQQ